MKTATASMRKLPAILSAAALAAGLILIPMTSSAQTAAPAEAKPAATAKGKKPPSPGQVAVRDRQKKCGAEWKEAKAAGKIEKGMKWPKFWSACNKRLKSAA